MKISEILLEDKNRVKRIFDLIEECKPLIGNPVATSDPANRHKLYALATVAMQLMPLMLMELCPLEKFKG